MLRSRIDSLEDVPEALREHYTPRAEGGGFELQTDSEEAEALRRALDHERTNRKHARQRLRQERNRSGGGPQVEHDAVDDDTPKGRFIRSAVSRLSAFEPGSAEHAAELARIESEMDAAINEELEPQWKAKVEADRQSLTADILRLHVENVCNDLTKRLAHPDAIDALFPLVKDRLSAERRDDGTVTVFAKTNAGERMTLDSLEQELRTAPVTARLVRGVTPHDQTMARLRVLQSIGEAHRGERR